MSAVTELRRVFTDAKIIESRALNWMGVQPFRAVLARLLYRLRSGSHDPMIAELSRVGIMLWEDFLPPASLDAVRSEAEEFMAESSPTWLDQNGTTEVRQFTLAGVDSGRFPHLAQWRRNEQVLRLAAAAERRRVRRGEGGGLFEHLRLGDYSQPDPQTDLHVDIFFNTHKLWLYLDDVTEENAPLVYVPGSHVLDRVRLRYDYVESTGANKESRPVSDDEIRSRGLERRVITCPRNTLVVANTCGYHCRSIGEPGATRRALHMAFRFNPFWFGSSEPSRVKRHVVHWTRRRSSR